MTADSPTSLPPLAVTGSSGGLGGMVAGRLAQAGVPQRLLVRSLDRAPRLRGAWALEAKYTDDGRTGEALAGVETLFMVSASESERRLEQHLAFVDAAAAAGVRHVVYTLFIGASPTATFTLARDHDATERHIVASGMGHTFLRDALYLDFLLFMVGDDGVIRGPAGDGRAAVVARAVTAVLADPSAHSRRTYDLTGPEALSLPEVAAILTEHLHRPVAFHDETVHEAYASRAPYGAPRWQVDAWVSTYLAIANGEMGPASSAVFDLTGEPPVSLAQFLAEQAAPSQTPDGD